MSQWTRTCKAHITISFKVLKKTTTIPINSISKQMKKASEINATKCVDHSFEH